MKVAVVYATDFGAISPGGIQNYVWGLGASADNEIEITYFGIGQLARALPRPQDNFISIGELAANSKVNLQFTLGLIKKRFKNYDHVVFHRADNVLATFAFPMAKRTLILHGGTGNALRAKKRLFNLSYFVVEVLARLLVRNVYSVDPDSTWFGNTRYLPARQAPVVFDKKLFNSENVFEKRSDLAVIGRLASEKRFQLAISAFERSNLSGSLHIVGDGPEMENLISVSKAGSKNVVFHGNLSPTEISKLLKSRVAALLITSKFEGFPLVAAEAAACLCKLVAIKAPGVTRAIGLLGGTLVGDEYELTKALEQLTLTKSAQSNSIDFEMANSPESFWRGF